MCFFDNDYNWCRLLSSSFEPTNILFLYSLYTAKNICDDQISDLRLVDVRKIHDRDLSRLDQLSIIDGRRFWVIKHLQTVDSAKSPDKSQPAQLVACFHLL